MNYVHLSKKAFQNVFPRYFWQFLVFLFAHLWQFFVFCICVFVATFCVNLRPFKMCFLGFFGQLFARDLISGGWLQSRLEPLPSFSTPQLLS